MTDLLQIITAATASCGFAIIFQIKPQHLKYIALGVCCPGAAICCFCSCWATT